MAGRVAELTLAGFIAELRTIAQREPAFQEATLRKCADEIRDQARAMIGTEDEAWPALADATIAEKERLGYVGSVSATDPLLRTGELRDSIEVRRVDAERAIVASDDPVLAYQEFGTARIPPRPVIGAVLLRSKAKLESLIGEAAVRFLRGGRTDG